MNILYIIIGLIFFINPNITFFDYVPDFIGCIFIIHGLKKASLICYDIKDSYAAFRNLLWANAARIPFYIIFLLLRGDQTLLLLFNFIFSAIESFLLIRGFYKLFAGFSYLAMRTDANDELYEDNESHQAIYSRINDAKVLTTIFIFLRVFCSIVPDLTVLSSTEYGDVTSQGIHTLAGFFVIFEAVGFVISLLYGILWFVFMRKYLLGINGDTEYLKNINRKYNNFVKKDPFVIVKDALFMFFVIITAGASFSIGLRFDGVNLIPPFIGSLFFIWAALTMRKYYSKSAKKMFVNGMIYAVVSCVSWIYGYVFIHSFFSDYLNSNEIGLMQSFTEVLEARLQKSFEVIYGFIGSIIVAFAECFALIFLIFAMKKLLAEIIREHTGNVVLHYEENREYDGTAHTTDALLKFLNVTTVFGILSAIASASESFLCILFPPIWFFEFMFRAVWVAMLIILVVRIKEAVKKKYFLE